MAIAYKCGGPIDQTTQECWEDFIPEDTSLYPCMTIELGTKETHSRSEDGWYDVTVTTWSTAAVIAAIQRVLGTSESVDLTEGGIPNF